MGQFKITIRAVGGHGVDRGKKHGEKVDFHAENSTDGRYKSPDSIAKEFVDELVKQGNNVESAVIVHWPETESQVMDNLLTGVRNGNF
jgi:hypothetical protein